MSTQRVSPAEARILLSGPRDRSKKRIEQLALDPRCSYARGNELWLAGVVHPPINEWKAWHWRRYNSEKEKWRGWVVAIAGRDMTRHVEPVSLEVVSYFRDARPHDCDNYTPKFILDGLVSAGVLKGDSSKYVRPLVLDCIEWPSYGTRVTIIPRA